MTAISQATGIERTQVARHYTPLPEDTHLIRTVPAWSRNLNTRTVRDPKVYVTDSGLAALLGVDLDGIALPDAPALGPLVETFVATELQRQLAYEVELASLWHFRSADGPEVDLVVEAPTEESWASRSRRRAPSPLAAFATWPCCEIASTGSASPSSEVSSCISVIALPFGDRPLAVPLSHLWVPPYTPRS